MKSCLKFIASNNFCVDFSPAFHWNIHQFYISVVAEYESKRNVIVIDVTLACRILCNYFSKVLNQVVVWDKVVKSNANMHVSIIDEAIKYILVDQSDELRSYYYFLV